MIAQVYDFFKSIQRQEKYYELLLFLPFLCYTKR